MVISGYYINGYSWIYFVIAYWWLLVAILFMAIGEYFIMNFGGY
jgi:uncharacterized membrane protein